MAWKEHLFLRQNIEFLFRIMNIYYEEKLNVATVFIVNSSFDRELFWLLTTGNFDADVSDLNGL